jgi:hypothetical protein
MAKATTLNSSGNESGKIDAYAGTLSIIVLCLLCAYLRNMVTLILGSLVKLLDLGLPGFLLLQNTNAYNATGEEAYSNQLRIITTS